MNSIINAMTKYDHRQHELSDWLLELEQRFQLGEVEADRAKITWCQLLIGATGNSILAGLDAETTWETAKETLLSRLGAGSVRDEAWAALKHLTRGSKEIIELAGEAEKLAKRLHPRDDLLSSLKTGCHAGSNLTPLYIGGQAVDCWIGVNIEINKAKIEKKRQRKIIS